MISFTLPGIPKPLKRHRSTKGGHMYDPSLRDKQLMWLQIAKYRPKLPYAGDIFIKMKFYLPHPKNRYKTKGGKPTKVLKDRYKDMIYHSYKPDIDNLVKMICDTIQGKGKMICDDSQICILQAEKLYGEPRTEVTIQEIH